MECQPSFDPRKSRVVELRFFGGASVEESLTALLQTLRCLSGFDTISRDPMGNYDRRGASVRDLSKTENEGTETVSPHNDAPRKICPKHTAEMPGNARVPLSQGNSLL